MTTTLVPAVLRSVMGPVVALLRDLNGTTPLKPRQIEERVDFADRVAITGRTLNPRTPFLCPRFLVLPAERGGMVACMALEGTLRARDDVVVVSAVRLGPLVNFTTREGVNPILVSLCEAIRGEGDEVEVRRMLRITGAGARFALDETVLPSSDARLIAVAERRGGRAGEFSTDDRGMRSILAAKEEGLLYVPVQFTDEIVAAVEAAPRASSGGLGNKVPPNKRPLLDKPVTALEGLSQRTKTELDRAKIRLIGQLVCKTGNDLLMTKGFGRKSIKDVKDALARIGLSLEMDVGDWHPPSFVPRLLPAS